MNVLIVNTGRFGDVIQSVPLIKGLKRKFDNSNIHYLLLENFKPAAELIEEIDNIISIDFSKILKDIDFNEFKASFLKVKDIFHNILDYDLLINLSFSNLSAIISGLINSKVKKGLIFTKNNEFTIPDNWSKFFLAIVDFREFSPFNLVDIFSNIGGVKSEKVFIKKDENINNIGFQLGASTENRRWPVKSFAKLAKIIHNYKRDLKIYLFGSKNEVKLGKEFERYYKSDKVINLIGKTTIKELHNYLKESIDVLITNDTGTMHLAWLLNKKVIELSLGPALYNTTGPYGDGHIIVQPDIECSPCSYQITCPHLKCHDLVESELIFNIIFDYQVNVNSKIKIFRTFYDEDDFLNYEKIYGNDDIFTLKRNNLKYLWLKLIGSTIDSEKHIKKTEFEELNKLIDEILKNIKKIYRESKTEKMMFYWEKIIYFEKILKNLIFLNYKFFIPFFKYFEFLKVFNESSNFLNLLKNYEIAIKKLQFSINNFS